VTTKNEGVTDEDITISVSFEIMWISLGVLGSNPS